MVTLPIAAFFLSYFFIFTPAEWGGDLYTQDSLTYSGIVSVVTVNLIMAFFVFYAVALEPDNDNEADQSESAIKNDSPVDKSTEKTKKPKKSTEKAKKQTTNSDDSIDNIEKDSELRSRAPLTKSK